VRIAYVLKVDDLKNAMLCLDEAMKVYPGRKIVKQESASPVERN
jgi:aspartate aminotransferase